MMGERRAAIQEGDNENHSQQPEVLHYQVNKNLLLYFSIFTWYNLIMVR